MIHPLVRDAARGELPPWSQAKKSRREHMARVSHLMGGWAAFRNLAEEDCVRWRAAGFLHDALRDADPEALRRIVGPELADAAGSLLHGPAAARLLGDEGVTDPPFVLAIAFHTLGHPELDALGLSLYAADFLEPGRSDPSGRLRDLRERMPEDQDAVVLEVAKEKILSLVEGLQPLRTETVAFWNGLVGQGVKAMGEAAK